MSFNWIDLLLAAIVVLSAFSGWYRGFVVASLDLIALVTSLVAAFLGYRMVADWLGQMAPNLGVWIPPLSFVGTFVLVHMVLSLVVRVLMYALPGRLHAHVLNRLLGLAPGAVNGLINATVAAMLLLTIPLFEQVSSAARESAIASKLAEPAEQVEAKLAPIFDPAVRRTLQALTVQPESKTSIPLRFRVANAKPRPDLEARMLEMVNAERAQAGLKPLKADPELAEVARAHSQDMFARGYFSHVTPDGQDLADRIRRAKLGYLNAGENLALAQTLGGAHQGLMNSPGHRKNILRPQFGRLGIGVLDGGTHGLMVTQNFRN